MAATHAAHRGDPRDRGGHAQREVAGAGVADQFAVTLPAPQRSAGPDDGRDPESGEVLRPFVAVRVAGVSADAERPGIRGRPVRWWRHPTGCAARRPRAPRTG